MLPTKPRSNAGRPSVVGTHPRRSEIEAAVAGGLSFVQTGQLYNLSSSAVYRYWKGLPLQYRAKLQREAQRFENIRLKELAAGLQVLAQRHPEAHRDIQALLRRVRDAGVDAGAHAG